MPSNISFALTTQQVIDETKFVTRRMGWSRLRPGTILNAVKKCMGLRPGERVEHLKQISVVSVRPEPLQWLIDDPEYGANEATLEGFPGVSGAEFVAMFCREMKVQTNHIANRIEFRYVQKQNQRVAPRPGVRIAGESEELADTSAVTAHCIASRA